MSNSKSRFPFSSFMLTSALLFLVLSVSTFHFSGCELKTEECEFSKFEITLNPNPLPMTAGSTETITINVILESQYCYDYCESFMAVIGTYNPYGNTLDKFGRRW